MRRVMYITGTRADFGLMRRTLTAIEADPELELSLVATGMHFSHDHGETIAEVRASGLTIAAEVPVELQPTTGATMARAIGAMISEFTTELERARPDMVLLLGDRGEMLAGAIAATHLNIPVAHIHGGERSGTIDEPVRHAISKLAHLHLAATQASADRLIRIGEQPRSVYVVGAPGLDGMAQVPLQSSAEVRREYGLDVDAPLALFLYHPVLQDAAQAFAATDAVLDALDKAGAAVLALMPNADAGGDAVRAAILGRPEGPRLRVLTHLPRDAFIVAMAAADLMIGNSSAGIIEAASFGTPVLNVGRRQQLRERNTNVIDVAEDPAALDTAIRAALSGGRYPPGNAYGDGEAAGRIVAILRDTALTPALLAKVNSF